MQVDDLQRELAARIAGAPAPPGNLNTIIRRGRRRIAIRRVAVGVTVAALAVSIAVPLALRQPAPNGLVISSLPVPGDLGDSSWALHPKAVAGLAEGSSFHALATSRSSLLLAGARPTSSSWTAAIWYSDDATTWKQAHVPTTTGEVVAIAAAGDLALAVGSEKGGSSGFVWESGDNGRHWTLIARGTQLFGSPAPQMGRPFVSGLLSVNGTWIANGGGSSGYAAVWTSRDGKRWRQVLDSADARAAGSVDITKSANGQLFGYWVTAGWYSADGTAWGQPVTLSVPERWFLRTVAPGAGVAFGDNLDRHGLATPLLRSHDDGRTWSIDPSFLAHDPDASVSTVTRAKGVWIAAGSSGSPNHPDAWISTDLTEWRPLPTSLYGTPGGTLSLIGRIGDRIVLLGTAPELDRYYTFDTRISTGVAAPDTTPAAADRYKCTFGINEAEFTADGLPNIAEAKTDRKKVDTVWRANRRRLLTNPHVTAVTVGVGFARAWKGENGAPYEIVPNHDYAILLHVASATDCPSGSVPPEAVDGVPLFYTVG
jgi:hypothetical protein